MFAELNRKKAKETIKDMEMVQRATGNMYDYVIIMWDSPVSCMTEYTTALFSSKTDAEKFAESKLDEKDSYNMMCCAIINGRVYEDHGMFS